MYMDVWLIQVLFEVCVLVHVVMFLQTRDCLAELKKESSKLQQTWQEQRERLDQVLEFQLFLRDAKNIDAMSGAHEVSGKDIHVHSSLFCYIIGES